MSLLGTTFRAEFCPNINNFKSINNLISQDEYIKTQPLVPLLSMVGILHSTNEKVPLFPSTPTVIEDDAKITITYSAFGGYKIQATLSINACNDSMLISADITNHQENLDIVEVLCPHISGIYLGDSYQDDVIIYPHHAGERTVNPIKTYGTDRVDFWRASSEPYGDIYKREINYCGLASMSWMYYYDQSNGLYIGSHDPRYPVTGIIAESGTEKTPYMGFGFRKYHRIATNESYNTGEYKIVITDKDWHYGAQIYREYIVPYLDFDHTPEFLKEESALNQCYNFKRTGVIENYFKDIPRMFDAGDEWGIRHMFIASWNRDGFDSYYPEYYPDMELGSAMEFRRGIEYVRDHGGFSTLYINARIFDLKSDFHKSVGEKMAIRNEKGEMYYETYGPQNFTVNCPSDQLWREYLIDTAEFAVKAYGADGIYLDQLASAEPFACYCKEHSHQNIGEFNNGYIYVLKELLSRLKKSNQNAYIMTENCGDIYGSYTWGNLTWNGADYDEHYQVFKYTFPEFVQVNMVNPRGWESDEIKRKRLFYKDMQRAILLGNVLWMGITARMSKHSGEYYIDGKVLNQFRKQLQGYLKDAEFLDNAYICECSDDCEATSWRLADGRYMILCGNYTKLERASVQVTVSTSCSKLTSYNLQWEKSEKTIHSNTFEVDFSGQSLLCIIAE